MKGILYFALIGTDSEVKSMSRYWFAEGFIHDDDLDLELTLKLGVLVQEEIQNRGILNLSDRRHLFFTRKVYNKIARVLDQEYVEYGGPVMVFNSTLVKRGKWRKDYRIFFRMTPSDIPYSPVCAQLSTIRISKNIFPDEFFKPMANVRVFYSNGTLSSLPSFIVSFGKTLKLLELSNLRSLEVSYLRTLEKLEVLNLEKAHLENMPENTFETLQSLRLLDLSQCQKLSSLPSSISLLLNLEMLLLSGCSQLNTLPSPLPLEKLQVLDLSTTSLTEIPEEFFFHLHGLKNLNLSFVSQLKFLPLSMSKLARLKKLNLKSCTSLLAVLPNLSLSLEELNLSNCSALKDTYKFSSTFERMRNLRSLDLTATNLEFLSLKGCSNLESVNLQSNTNLAALDLSGTKIQKFPLESNSDIKSLRRLDLLGVKNLLNVNWRDIHWLPPRVNWDQCSDGSISRMIIPLDEWFRVGNEDGVLVSVSDAIIFKSLTPSSLVWNRSPFRFLIYIHPCNGKSPPPLSSTYKDVYSKLKPRVPLYDRCLEIGGVNSLQKVIHGVLSHTNFLYLHDEKNVVKLSDLGLENMGDLKECWLERCNKMVVAFDVGRDDLPESKQIILGCLEKMHISNLKKLCKVFDSIGILKSGSFSRLKHLQVECCPQLVTLASSGVCFENLEVLEIRHCARLEEIFSGEVHVQGSLQRLHTLVLLELPSLSNIVHNVSLLSLQKARIKGCPKLRKLPIGANASVAITGEVQWWDQLEWDDKRRKHSISFTASAPIKFHTST